MPNHLTNATSFVQPLLDGPVDLIGDVHGEFDALQDVLAQLGYDARGCHPDDRRLVFVGDLCDRGPDSVAVIDQVAGMVEHGRAQCIAGNHELNLLRGARKEGNGWYFDQDHDRADGKFRDARRATASERAHIKKFLHRLPVALQRADLRVVHACWDGAALQRIVRAADSELAGLYDVFEAESHATLAGDGTLALVDQEERRHAQALQDPNVAPPLLPALARRDEARQMANPLRVVTSGVERVAQRPFFSSGKWRMTERIAWWDEYTETTPVVMGHYWRWPVAVDREVFGKGGPDLFEGTRFDAPLGPRHNVYCVDYSVGRRFHERQTGGPFQTRLAALRWPERSLVFDDGSRHVIEPSSMQANT